MAEKLKIFMLGGFYISLSSRHFSTDVWDRDRSLQLFQFLLCQTKHRFLHKEQIIDKLWFELELKNADQTFKTALHGTNKTLKEIDHSFSQLILRQGATYRLNMDEVWLDTAQFRETILRAQKLVSTDAAKALECYLKAIALYKGPLLPTRMYEEWCTDEREQLHLLYMNALTDAAMLALEPNPSQSLYLAQLALQEDETWESAYSLQMQAYIKLGNRPMAIKSYEKCTEVLQQHFGIEPLPATKKAFKSLLLV